MLLSKIFPRKDPLQKEPQLIGLLRSKGLTQFSGLSQKSLLSIIIKNSKGVSLVETSISIAMGLGMIAFFLKVIYVCCAGLWNQHNLYEGLICIMEQESRYICEKSVMKSIDDYLPFGKVTHLKLYHDRGKYSAQLKWTFHGRTFQKKLNLSYKDLYKKRKRVKNIFL